MRNTQTERSLAIIDDHSIIRQSLGGVMREAGFNVLFDAENGMECLEKLARCPRIPDALILDIDMPVMNGIDAAFHIKRAWPEMRIIMYSLNNDQLTVKKAMEAGADLVLWKNCEAKELITAVQG